MPRVVITIDCARGVERCRQFLADKSPQAAARAMQTVLDAMSLLRTSPDIGRPHSEYAELRELLIEFGRSGYVALYEHDPNADEVRLLAFRHQKEAGY